MTALAIQAWADGVVTPDELTDLIHVAALLGLHQTDVDRALIDAAAEDPSKSLGRVRRRRRRHHNYDRSVLIPCHHLARLCWYAVYGVRAVKLVVLIQSPPHVTGVRERDRQPGGVRERDKLGEVERRLPRVGLACGPGQRRRSGSSAPGPTDRRWPRNLPQFVPLSWSPGVPWYNSGAVEGTVNRIKQLKTAMYGRANPDLLRKLILLA